MARSGIPGWQRQGRIDEKNHIWYAAARVPLSSVSDIKVKEGTKWRVNLYRIDGLGRGFRAPFHVLAGDLRRQSRSKPCAGTFWNFDFHNKVSGRIGYALRNKNRTGGDL